MNENKTEEEQAETKKTLFQFDDSSHPLRAMLVESTKFSVKVETKTQVNKNNNEPVKSRALYRKTNYVPPWWKGEKAAFANARVAMQGINNLPKMKTK